MIGGRGNYDPVPKISLLSNEDDGKITKVLTDLGIYDVKGFFYESSNLTDSDLYC